MRSGKPYWRRLALVGGLATAACALSGVARFGETHALMINASPSLPYWAIWLDRSATPGRGDVILFDPPTLPLVTAHFGKDPKPFGKRVAGIAGDVVTIRNRDIYVNGRFVARAKPKSRRGEPLALGPTGIVPAGCYFATTGHKDGFDSRYAAIGWVCKSQILGVGRPIL